MTGQLATPTNSTPTIDASIAPAEAHHDASDAAAPASEPTPEPTPAPTNERRVRNLCGVTVSFRRRHGSRLSITPEQVSAEVHAVVVAVDDHPSLPIRVDRVRRWESTGLPAPEAGTLLIVTPRVYHAFPRRDDLVTVVGHELVHHGTVLEVVCETLHGHWSEPCVADAPDS